MLKHRLIDHGIAVFSKEDYERLKRLNTEKEALEARVMQLEGGVADAVEILQSKRDVSGAITRLGLAINPPPEAP
jgi:hypothetical protein